MFNARLPRFPNKMSDDAKDFITHALEKNPIERPTVMDMLGHSWLTSASAR